MKGTKIELRWRAALLGTAVAAVTMVCACAAAAGLMSKGASDPGMMGYWSAGILVGSGLLGSLTAMLGGGGPVEAALAALGELVVLFALNAGLNGGQMEGIGVTVLALAGGCGAAILIRMGKGRGRKRPRRRRKS